MSSLTIQNKTIKYMRCPMLITPKLLKIQIKCHPQLNRQHKKYMFRAVIRTISTLLFLLIIELLDKN